MTDGRMRHGVGGSGVEEMEGGMREEEGLTSSSRIPGKNASIASSNLKETAGKPKPSVKQSTCIFKNGTVLKGSATAAGYRRLQGQSD